MRKVKIITDSCADLNSEMLEQYDIDYAKMSIQYNGNEYPALLTWTAEEAHELYEVMRSGKRIITAQVSMAEFERIFKKYVSEGYDVVYISCSSKQSGSINTGNIVARDIMKKYPEVKIICIDSLNASIGEGMLAIEAAKLARESKGAEEIAEIIISRRKKVQEFVTVHSLDALKRAGRVSASSAFFGNIFGVKPIIVSDVDGTQAAYKKVKGRQTSLAEIVSLLKEKIINPEEQTVYVAHGDCSEKEINRLTETIKSEIKCKDVAIWYIGPIVGASIGPDAVGVWGFGEEVTFKAQ